MVQGHNFGDRDFGFFFAKVIICAQLAYLDGFVWRVCIFFTIHTCDISFLGKVTLLDMFMTFKLSFEHSWLLTRAFLDRASAHTCLKVHKGGGVHSM